MAKFSTHEALRNNVDPNYNSTLYQYHTVLYCVLMSGEVSSPHSFLFLTLLVLEYANFPRDFLKKLGDLMGTLTSFVTEIIRNSQMNSGSQQGMFCYVLKYSIESPKSTLKCPEIWFSHFLWNFLKHFYPLISTKLDFSLPLLLPAHSCVCVCVCLWNLFISRC